MYVFSISALLYVYLQIEQKKFCKYNECTYTYCNAEFFFFFNLQLTGF